MAKVDITTGLFQELRQFELFQKYSDAEIATLCRGCEAVQNSHREVLFQMGDKASRFAIVLSGAYKLCRMGPMGEDSVIYFAIPGDVVGALMMSQPGAKFPVTSRAMGESRAILIHRDVYQNEWITRPELVTQIQGLLSARMAMLQNQKTMQRAPLAARLSAFLMQIVAKDSGADHPQVPVPLTRQEIADALGATVESVIRIMSEWHKLGWVSTTDQHISILRPDQVIRQFEKQ